MNAFDVWQRLVSGGLAVATAVGLMGMLAACGGGGAGNEGNPGAGPIVAVPRPAQTGDGWLVASPIEAGLDERPLIEAIERIRHGDFNEIHSLLIVRNGRLVLEEYGRGRMYDSHSVRPDHLGPVIDFHRDRKHIVHSVSKSYLSTLIGIAVREGYISSADASLLGYFPEIASIDDPRKAEITLQHTMSMVSGLQWNEWEVAALDFQNNDAMRFQRALSPPGYFFGKALMHEPGTFFYYNTAGFQMLGEVLRRATGMRVDQFAARYLFEPLGVTDFDWPQFEHELVYIVGDLFLKPRDMARLGQLVLQHGEWQARQIVPAAWLDQATASLVSVAHTGFKGYQSYGLYWWSKVFHVAGQAVRCIHAEGLAGQAIMVCPSLELVIVVTSGNYNRPELEHALVADFVLPAVTD